MLNQSKIFSSGYPLGAFSKGSEIFREEFKGSIIRFGIFKRSENFSYTLIYWIQGSWEIIMVDTKLKYKRTWFKWCEKLNEKNKGSELIFEKMKCMKKNSLNMKIDKIESDNLSYSRIQLTNILLIKKILTNLTWEITDSPVRLSPLIHKNSK